MFKSGTFSPVTQHELTATLDVTWQALSGARQNMRLLDEERARLEKSIERLKGELQQAQARSKEAADAIRALEQQLRESEERYRALEERVKGAASQSADVQKARDAHKAEAEELRKQLAAAEVTIQTLKKDFGDSEEQRRALEGELGKARERQTAIEAELSDARAAMAKLTEEKERLQRELAEVRAEIGRRDAQIAADAELGAALQTDVGLLQQAMQQLDKRLDSPLTDPLLTPTYKDRRVIWIGCKDCPGCGLFAEFSMVKLAASSPDQALEMLSGQQADAVVTDIAITGIEWLTDVRQRWPDLIIIVTTGPADSHLAVSSSLCRVATTVLTQPYEHEDVAVAVRCAFMSKVVSSGGEALGAERTPTRARLLIAEDDETTRTLISTCLNEHGYDITGVEDGVAALEALAANDFDVLVTDLLMPRMDGIELTAKAKTVKPRLPVIVLSAAGDVETSLKAMRAGAYCYVPKPADIAELSLFIERAMLSDRLERELREQNSLLDKRTNELDKALHELQGLQETINQIAARRRPQAECAGQAA